MICDINSKLCPAIFLLFATLPIQKGPASLPEALATQSANHPGSQSELQISATNPDKVLGSPQCTTTGTNEITITCDYTAAPRSKSESDDKPRVVLNRAVISFDPFDEANLRLELTFTNEGTGRTLEERKIYLSVDDDRGRNYVRRLTKIDFHNLDRGERRTHSDVMLVAVFRPGHYTVHLWIPDPDPAFKFEATHNFLFSSVGVPEMTTVLNRLADFTVAPSKQSKQRR